MTIAACSTAQPPAGSSPDEAYAWNLAAAGDAVAEAARLGAEIACLPETFATCGAAAALPLEPLPDGPTARWCADLARRHGLHLIAPLAGILDGVSRNAALWFDGGGAYQGAYCKVHLTTPEIERGIVPGDEWTVFPIPCRDAGIVHVGVFICFDVNFPEAARLLALRGAEILFHPTVYSMYGEAGWEAVLRARAIDNCVYICTVNHGIRDDEPWMPGMSLGRSGVVGPDGLTLAETGRYADTVVATLDLARPRLVRAFGVGGEADFRHQLWRHRRPETYTALATSGAYMEESGATPAANGACARRPHQRA
ncbi:MAG: carbon-nitrogen hydrolase family protein [Chloroflexota bacterium]